MKSGLAVTFNSLVLAVMIAASLWARSLLPDAPIATHFDARGVADGFQSRDIGLTIMPLGVAFTGVLMWSLKHALPGKDALNRSSAAYTAVWVSVVAILGFAHGFIISHAFEATMDARLLLAAPGLLLIILGNFMPKMRQNRVMGVRTPWTLRDERVWDRTHNVSGPLFMLGGAALIVATFLVPPEQITAAILICTLTPSIVAVAYSWWVARQV
jgi:uncharacterized membrane protein